MLCYRLTHLCILYMSKHFGMANTNFKNNVTFGGTWSVSVFRWDGPKVPTQYRPAERVILICGREHIQVWVRFVAFLNRNQCMKFRILVILSAASKICRVVSSRSSAPCGGHSTQRFANPPVILTNSTEIGKFITLYWLLLITNLTHFFVYLFIYFVSLHVWSITVLIIRGSNGINTSCGMISVCKWLLGMPVRGELQFRPDQHTKRSLKQMPY